MELVEEAESFSRSLWRLLLDGSSNMKCMSLPSGVADWQLALVASDRIRIGKSRQNRA